MRPLAYYPHPLSTVAARDLLLLERLEMQPTNVVLEVGTGSGSSLFRLGRFVAAMHGADVARGPIERLRQFVPRFRGPNRELDVFVLDFCDRSLPPRVAQRYDLIYSCDTLEHIPDPPAFFANLYALLKPGGRIFVTFPNERPERAHGITFFSNRTALLAILEAAGFVRHDIRVQTVTMSGWAEKVLKAGWLFPRNIYKRSVAGAFRHRPTTDAPQTFDETAFFSTADRFEPVAPVINAYSWAVMRLMSLVRPVYATSAAGEDIWDTQVLIEARRGGPSGPES